LPIPDKPAMLKRGLRSENPRVIAEWRETVLAKLRRLRIPGAAVVPWVVPASILFSVATFLAAGRSSVTTVSSNYIPPGTFVFETIAVRSYPGTLAGAFEISMQLSEEPGRGIWTIPPASSMLLQVDTGGRSMAFRIQSEGESGTFEERTQRVSDRDWLDLGTVPVGLRPKKVRVESVSGGPFTFRIPMTTQRGDLRELTVRPVESATSTNRSSFSPRYRIVEKRPVPPLEALARILFFPSASRVLLVSLLVGLVATTMGPIVMRRHTAAGVLLAVVGVALLHASLRPILRGEDEVAHISTVEAVVWNPELLHIGGGPVPRSLDPIAEATEMQIIHYFDTDAIVPVTSVANRRAVRDVLDRAFAREAAEPGGRTPFQGTQPIQQRGRLYYPLFGFGGPVFRRLGLLDRFAAYRIASTLLALAIFTAGASLLRFGRMPDRFLILYGCAGLLPPYLMSLLTTVSNYSMAIGCGFLFAAATVVLALSERSSAKILAGIALVGGGWAAVWVWTDFLMLAPLVTPVVAAVSLVAFVRHVGRRMGGRTWLTLVVVIAALGGGSVVAYRSIWPRFSSIASAFRALFSGSRMPLELSGPDSPLLLEILQVVMLPVMLASVFGLLGLLGRRLPVLTRDRLAFVRSALFLAFFIVMFFMTPFATVPTDTRLTFVDEVQAHWNAFWSTTFSLTQDNVSWRMYWGVFGWADTKYPDIVYAAAKWSGVALFLSLPILCRRFQRERPWISTALLVTSGLAVSFAFATNTLRYLQPSNPWGRYILPWVPLAVLPAVARIDWTPRREAALRWIFLGAIVLHVWTAISLVGTRYFIPH
jgi:hypothetical protein